MVRQFTKTKDVLHFDRQLAETISQRRVSKTLQLDIDPSKRSLDGDLPE